VLPLDFDILLPSFSTMPWHSKRWNGSSLHQTFIAHQLVEEARVQQMQDRVFDAADVLVNRQPVVGTRGSSMPLSKFGQV
jgi:hypothetical protein